MYVEIIILREVAPPQKHVLPHLQTLAINVVVYVKSCEGG